MHVDMDAFFASVEQLDHPDFRGKPVIVGADPSQGRGVVSAASYEAREFGIHSAMPISQAFAACPHGIFVQPRFKRYKELSDKMFDIFRDFSPSVEPISIDEAFIDLTGTERLHGPAEDVGRKVKARILDETGLVASVGIAPNKFLAKLASDFDKPDGFVVIHEDEVRQFLDPLPIGKLWGVGPSTEKALRSLGISTVRQLAIFDEAALCRVIGDHGSQLIKLARGEDDRDFQGDYRRKGISIEQTYIRDVTDRSQLIATMRRLSDKLAGRMRNEGISGRTITVKVRYTGFITISRSSTSPFVFHNAEEIFEEAMRLAMPELEGAVRLLGIRIGNLCGREGEQLRLFGGEDRSKIERLEKALDEITSKFGEGSIERAKNISKSKED
jgi:DNA polymerase-4